LEKSFRTFYLPFCNYQLCNFNEFERFTRAKNRVEKTISNYKKEFNYFYNWYGDEDIGYIDQDVIISYIEFLKKEGNRKPVSINTALRHLKAIILGI